MSQKVLVCLLAVICCLVTFITCPPVTEKPPLKEDDKPDTKADDEMNLGLVYEHYLKEVVSVLEMDENFKKKLEESNISDIKSGEIAKHLDFVAHGIRTRLDEAKRKEIDRIRQMMRLQGQLKNGLKSVNPEIVLPAIDKERLLGHLDHSNPNSFEVSDLAKLIQQATKDLESIDQKRREDFKKYEMEKEVLRREEMKKLDEEHRAEEENKFAEMQKKHQDHPKLHHPGNEAQLQDVWEETDGLSKQDFDPKTFFYLHDTNSDSVLDEAEIEALFQKELDKVYDPDAPEDDMLEREEEMNRMREHVMNEVDKNKDRLISLEEFINSTKSEEFKKDDAWETLDKQPVYSEEELDEFQRQYEEFQRQQQLKQQEQKEQKKHAPPEQEIPMDKTHLEPKLDQQVHVMQQQGENQQRVNDHPGGMEATELNLDQNQDQQHVPDQQEPFQGDQHQPVVQEHQQQLQLIPDQDQQPLQV